MTPVIGIVFFTVALCFIVGCYLLNRLNLRDARRALQEHEKTCMVCKRKEDCQEATALLVHIHEVEEIV